MNNYLEHYCIVIRGIERNIKDILTDDEILDCYIEAKRICENVLLGEKVKAKMENRRKIRISKKDKEYLLTIAHLNMIEEFIKSKIGI